MLHQKSLAYFFWTIFNPKKTARNTSFQYFVSYTYTVPGASFDRSFGCMEIIREKQVQSFEDVAAMVELIKQTLWLRHNLNGAIVVILNWQPFENASQNCAQT